MKGCRNAIQRAHTHGLLYFLHARRIKIKFHGLSFLKATLQALHTLRPCTPLSEEVVVDSRLEGRFAIAFSRDPAILRRHEGGASKPGSVRRLIETVLRREQGLRIGLEVNRDPQR